MSAYDDDTVERLAKLMFEGDKNLWEEERAKNIKDGLEEPSWLMGIYRRLAIIELRPQSVDTTRPGHA